MPSDVRTVRSRGRAAAWAVHAFTASGAFLAFLALMAALEERWALAFAWLIIALVVDGVDGTLARRARVAERAPRIDGPALDLIIDYLNFVFVPAVIIWRAGLVPEKAAPWLAAAVLVSALYNFARRDMKTEDNYFRGFPALWNVVALYLFVAGLNPAVGAAVVAALTVLTFAPVHFVHPVRVRDFRPWLQIAAMLWAVSTAALLWPGWSEPARSAWLAVSALSALLIVALGFVRTLRGPA